MKAKIWVAIYLVLFSVGILGYMVLNYVVDPMQYYTVEKGHDTYDADSYTRYIKSDYVSKNTDEIEAVVIGGSKSGVISTDLLKEYTGLDYYNFYMSVGNFSDYLAYIEFLLNTCDLKEITLHLSSFEVKSYSREHRSSNYEVPAIVNGSLFDQFTETLSYLTSDIATVIKNINPAPASSINYLSNGERKWVSAESAYQKDIESYIKKRFYKELAQEMKYLKNELAASYPAFDDNIKALRTIKDMCDEKGVTLKLMIGASFVGEHRSYECDRYYDYLLQIVDIMDVWDFSDFNEVNMNPYNFINTNHYSRAVADLMVNTMYGKDSKDGFGIYLTKDNIYDYLKERREKRLAVVEEYETTGTLSFGDKSSDSFVEGEIF